MLEERKRKEFATIDMETGEIIRVLREGDIETKIIRKESLDAIEGKVINFNRSQSFVKTYDDGMKKIGKKLTNAQFSFICHLLPQIEYNTNILRNDDGTLIEIIDMEHYTGMGYNSNYKLITSLVRIGIVGKWEVGSVDKKDLMFNCFVVNPYIFHKGTMVFEGLLELFGNTGWRED